MNDPQPEVLNQLPSRAQRLDRLKFGREHGKLLVGSGVGWALDDHNKALITPAMKAAVDQAEKDILSGKIVVHDYMADKTCPY